MFDGGSESVCAWECGVYGLQAEDAGCGLSVESCEPVRACCSVASLCSWIAQHALSRNQYGAAAQGGGCPFSLSRSCALSRRATLAGTSRLPLRRLVTISATCTSLRARALIWVALRSSMMTAPWTIASASECSFKPHLAPFNQYVRAPTLGGCGHACPGRVSHRGLTVWVRRHLRRVLRRTSSAG